MTSPSHRPSLPALVLDAQFEDIDSYGAVVGNWDLDFRQLDAGPLCARVKIVANDRCAALQVGFDRSFHQRGCAPEEPVVLGLPDRPLYWCGRRAVPGDVLNFNLSSGFEGVSEAGFSGTVFLLDRSKLEDRLTDLGLASRGLELSERPALWRGSRVEIHGLRRRAARALRTFAAPEGRAEAHDLLNGGAEATLLGVLVSAVPQYHQVPSSDRRRALRVALEALEDSSRYPLRVADLCSVAEVSRPTLYRAFREHLGVSPKRYLQVRRLAGVRRDLLGADPRSQIAGIANRWGFWHMGQFAADYRRQFGELPSETLRRR